MVDGIGPTSAGRIAGVHGVANVAPVSRAGLIARAAAAGRTPNPAADLAAYGPPLDHARIVELQQAIAAGVYKPDPAAIAGKMIALDLPAPVETGSSGNTGKSGTGTGK